MSIDRINYEREWIRRLHKLYEQIEVICNSFHNVVRIADIENISKNRRGDKND